MTNGDWRVYAESARSMQPYHHTVKFVSKSDMQKVFDSYDSTYNNVAEFRALAAIVGVTL